MKGLWLVTSLLMVALLAGGCVGKSKDMGPLTDEEKDRLIEIALDVPEVSDQLVEASVYKVEVRWVALYRRGSEVVEWAVLTDEEVEAGIHQGFLASFTIYPGVLISFGESQELYCMVAIDLDAGKVMHVELVPARPTAEPAPAKETD